MKKLLFLSSRAIFPVTDGGRIRTFQNLQMLSKHFEIHVVCIVTDLDAGEAQKEYCDYGKCEMFCVSRWRHYYYALRFLFNNLPIQVNYYYSPKIQKYLNSIVANYDVVFCNNIRTAHYIRNIRSKKVLDFVDAISMNYEKARSKVNLLKRLIYYIDYKRCLKYEQAILEQFDATSIISKVDRDYILSRSCNKKDIAIVPNMVNFDISFNTSMSREDNLIVFVGKMNYDPNVLAVTNFVKYIFPLIKQKCVNAKFYVVGISPSKSIQQLDNSDDVIVTGFVQDVRAYLLNASIVIAPMLSGAGIQNKIIEAMSLGCCVVTTTIGAEGLNIQNEEIAVVDGNTNLADKIVELLREKDERKIMGEKARNYIKENLTYSSVVNFFDCFIEPYLK